MAAFSLGSVTLNPYPLIWRADPVRIAFPAPQRPDLAALRSAIPRFAWARPFGDGCRGRVGADTVVLWYQRPFRRKDMSPVLDARLTTIDGILCLNGIYRMSHYGRVFMTIWFSFLILLLPFFFLAGVSDLLAGNLAGLGFAVAPLMMLGFGLALLQWGQSGWAEDKRLIEAFVVARVG